MAGRKSDFTLTKLDDLFTTQAQRDEEQLSKIRDIPLELIDDFPDHPFKVRDDEDMMQLVESVKERGVITPATVRQKEDGRYELVSGHRRKRACELAGFETLRSEIVDLNRDEATILMVESNFQRSEILPSEKAFAYKMRLEAMKRQAGRPSKENGVPVGHNSIVGKSREILASESQDSNTQIEQSRAYVAARGAKILSYSITINGYDSMSSVMCTQDEVDPGTEKARKELEERLEKRKAEKKETEERLEKQRAEKQEQEERQYNLKIDGKDVDDLTGKMVELLGTSTSIGVTENGVSAFDALA